MKTDGATAGHPDFPVNVPGAPDVASIFPISETGKVFSWVVVVGAAVVVGASVVAGGLEVVLDEAADDDPQAASKVPAATAAKLPANAPGLRYLPEEIAI